MYRRMSCAGVPDKASKKAQPHPKNPSRVWRAGCRRARALSTEHEHVDTPIQLMPMLMAPRLPLADILHRSFLFGLVGLGALGIYSGTQVHHDTLRRGKGNISIISSFVNKRSLMHVYCLLSRGVFIRRLDSNQLLTVFPASPGDGYTEGSCPARGKGGTSKFC